MNYLRGPTEAGFLEFIRGYMLIPCEVLPDDAPVIGEVFCTAVDTVNRFIQLAVPRLYNQAVYNLAGDFLINFAPDVQPFVVYQDKLPYFAYYRKRFNINGFVSGVITSASDQGTGDSLLVPESLGQLSLADLQALKTPWGRNYLAIAQKWGPDLFGIT